MEAFPWAEGTVALDKREAKAACAATETPAADLAELYDRHAPAVYRLLVAMLGSAEDAQDALSEIFLHAARLNLRRIRNPRAYLLASARNQAISILRRRKREIPTDLSDWRFFDTTSLDPQQAVLARRVEAALRGLPAEQREVIALKVYEGLTFAEIAAVTRVPANTVASRYRYAAERLRRALKEFMP